MPPAQTTSPARGGGAAAIRPEVTLGLAPAQCRQTPEGKREKDEAARLGDCRRRGRVDDVVNSEAIGRPGR